MSDALEQLTHDHRILLAEVVLIRQMLARGPRQRAALHGLCVVFLHDLETHRRREHTFVAAPHVSGEAAGPIVTEDGVEHGEQADSLQLIVRCLDPHEPPPPFDQVRLALTAVLDSIRERIHVQEAEFFPAMMECLHAD